MTRCCARSPAHGPVEPASVDLCRRRRCCRRRRARHRGCPGCHAGEALGRGRVHRRARDGRRRVDPVLRHRRPDHAVRPGDRQDDGLPRAERPGQRPDLRSRGAADRRRGGEHRRRPAGLDHRARRHGPHAGRPLPGQAVQQPQRRRRRPRRAASTSPTPATSATSRASSTSRPSSGSTPTAPSPGSRPRPRSPTAWRSAPTARRFTSPTTAGGGRCWRSTSTRTATSRTRVLSTSATAGASTA